MKHAIKEWLILQLLPETMKERRSLIAKLLPGYHIRGNPTRRPVGPPSIPMDVSDQNLVTPKDETLQHST